MTLRELTDSELDELYINLIVGPPRHFGKTELWTALRESVKAEIDVRKIIEITGKEDLFSVESYKGVCPICGSKNAMIVFSGSDGKYRIVCRVLSCSGFYIPLPELGYDTVKECKKLINGEPLIDQYAKIKEANDGNT